MEFGTRPHEIEGTAKEVAGQMTGDPCLEYAGRHERRGGVAGSADAGGEAVDERSGSDLVGEAAVVGLTGTVKEAVGRLLGVTGLARRGRRERRRRHAPGTE